ncbi:DUF4185 domain-containing protein [Elusimicrobiota bacterium]
MKLSGYFALNCGKLAVSLFFILSITSACSADATNEGIFGKSRTQYVLGQDGVTPIPITDTQGNKAFFWTFGDTILGTFKEGSEGVSTSDTFNFGESTTMEAMLPNSLAISEVPDDSNYTNLNFRYLMEDGKVAQFIKYEEGENPFLVRFWADDGIQIGNTVYIYYMIIHIDQNAKPYPFKVVGTGLAKWEMPPDWTVDNIDAIKFTRVKGFQINDIIVGDGAIERNGYVYLLNRIAVDPLHVSLVLARVAPENIEDPQAYEYLGRSKYAQKGIWQETPELFFDDIAGEASISYNEKLKKYVIIYMTISDQSVVMLTFKNFATFPAMHKATTIYKPDSQEERYYSGKEIFSTDNFIYAIYIDPSIYQPILLKTSIDNWKARLGLY